MYLYEIQKNVNDVSEYSAVILQMMVEIELWFQKKVTVNWNLSVVIHRDADRNTWRQNCK